MGPVPKPRPQTPDQGQHDTERRYASHAEYREGVAYVLARLSESTPEGATHDSQVWQLARHALKGAYGHAPAPVQRGDVRWFAREFLDFYISQHVAECATCSRLDQPWRDLRLGLASLEVESHE